MVTLDEQEKSQERHIDSIKDDKATISSKQDQHMEKIIEPSVDVTKVINCQLYCLKIRHYIISIIRIEICN